MRPTRIEPGPGKESVWDYPRPPRLEPCSRRIRIEHAGLLIAETTRAWRVLETSHPPVYYLPRPDVRMEAMEVSQGRSSSCEWKGRAVYFSIVAGDRRVRDAAWSYPNPTPAFAAIKDHLAFYASKLEACWVDDERVAGQPGDFYGGWITPDIVGPFKGDPGTWGW